MSYSNRYANLMKPLVLPNGKILKNRVMSGCSTNNFVMGGNSKYPTDEMVTYFANRAKNGASLLILTGMADKYWAGSNNEVGSVANMFKGLDGYKVPDYIVSEFYTYFDILDKKTHCMWTKLTEEVHMHQSLIISQMIPMLPKGYDVSEGLSNHYLYQGQERKAAPKELLDEMRDEFVKWAVAEKECGFDGVEIFCGVDWPMPARMLSPLYNTRTDEYGGSLENRARWMIDFCQAIKDACGKDFLIMIRTDPGGRPGSVTRDDMLEFCKMLEDKGLVDIFSLFHPDIANDMTHPSPYDPDNHYPIVEHATAFKKDFVKMGMKTPLAAIGGFNNLDDMEGFLKEDRFDLYDNARCWISNPEYGKCMREGRGEDIIPCLRCNKCHSRSMLDTDVWAITQCAVNPTWGIENRIDRLGDEPTCKKSVGIIGGGPAGMRSALYAAQRGHDVTIYEKSDKLGGLLNAAEGIDFKWPLNDYKAWLIYQVEKHPNISVELNTEADSELMRAKGHNAVLAAIGSTPIVPPIPGIENAENCYSFMVEKKDAGKNVVIIGGGDVGVDCGMDLAAKGHNVTVLEMRGAFAPGSRIMHTTSHLFRAIKRLTTFAPLTNVKVTNIGANFVEYVDVEGTAHTIEADTILYATGLAARPADVVELSDSTSYEFYCLGDCKKPASLAELNRDAYGITATL